MQQKQSSKPWTKNLIYSRPSVVLVIYLINQKVVFVIVMMLEVPKDDQKLASLSRNSIESNCNEQMYSTIRII